MSKARDLADFQGSASALTTGTLPVDRVPYVGRRNMIINGDFQVSQRGDFTTATSLTGTPTYHVDRWAGYDNVVSGTFTDLGKKIRLDATSTGTGQVRIDQKIETQDILPNQTYTMSAWVKSNKSGAGIAIYNDKTSAGGDTDVYSSFHSGSGDWEYLTVTMTTHSTEPNIFFCRVALTPLGNTATSAGEYLEAKEVQLELGSVATPFEHRSYGEELALCQRYYNRITAAGYANRLFSGSWSSSTVWETIFSLPVPMRTAPTCSSGPDAANDDWVVTVNGNVGTAAGLISSFSLYSNDSTNQRLKFTVQLSSGVSTSGAEGQLRARKNPTNYPYVSMDAEL